MANSLSPPAAPPESGDLLTPWLTTHQAAKRAKVGPKTIYTAVAAGNLRAARIGGRRSLRFLAAWVDDWLEATAQPIELTRGTSLRVAR